VTTYYTQGFESATVPALPSGWSSYANGGTIVTDSTYAHSGTKSLQLTPAANTNQWAWATGVNDSSHGCVVMDFWWYWTGTRPGSYTGISWGQRIQAAPSTGNWPQGYSGYCGFASTDSGLQFGYNNGTGTNRNIISYNPSGWSSLFAVSTWYRIICVTRDAMPGTEYSSSDGQIPQVVYSIYMQRGSDNAWLVAGSSSASWVATGVQTAVALARDYSIRNTYLGSGLALIGAYVASGSTFSIYVDDVSFYDFAYPPSITSIPTWTPGNSVELMGTYISVDSGSSALSNISDGNFGTAYVSTAAFEGWAGLDIGAGNTASLTRVLLSPETDAGCEHVASDLVIEGSSNETTWTSLGTSCSEADNRYNMIPLPLTAGSAYRYFRARTSEWPMRASEIRFEGTISSGSPTWKPIRPTITPAAGKLANGSTITLSTPTSGASIYYTLAVYSPFSSVPLYGGNGSAPTNASTLYSGPITLPSNQVTAIQAVAYVSTNSPNYYSDVSHGVFTCPLEYIPDTGATRFGTSNNWSEDLWDSGSGFLLNGGYPSLFYDTVTAALYMVCNSHNSANSGNDPQRWIGEWAYSSTDYYNWKYSFRVPQMPVYWRDTFGNALLAAGCPAIHMTASPHNSNYKYVLWANITNENCGVATAPAITGPWTWLWIGVPYAGEEPSDVTLFTDQNGDVWLVYQHIAAAIHAMKLDPSTDYTSFTGMPVTLDTTTAREAMLLFTTGGSYYLISSAQVDCGAGNSQVEYKAATGASLSAVASALNSGAWSSIWSSAPASGTVPYNAQTFGLTALPNSNGYLMTLNLTDPGESPITIYHERPAFYPLPSSAITTGASPAISMAHPSTWTLASTLFCIGTGVITLGAITPTGSGAFAAPGSGAITLGSIVVAGGGAFTAPGSGAVTLGSLTPSGSGAFNAPGSGTITLGSLTPAGTAGFTSPGSGAITLGALTPAGTGSFSTSAFGTVMLGSVIVAGAGIGSGVSGSGAVTLGSLTPAGAGAFAAPASGAIALGAITAAGTGGFTAPASGAVTLGSMVVAGAGTASGAGVATGSGSVTFAALTVAGAGISGVTALGTVTLGSIIPTGVGSFSASGSGAITLGALSPAGVATFTTTGSGTVALAALIVAGAGTATGPGVTTGSGAITLGSIIVTSMASGGGVGPLYFPYEFVSVLIDTCNLDPFFIDPEQTVLITKGSFLIDPEQTVLITKGLTPAD
jgi:Chitobiase/beta-hexosaminidase C-terminal domain